MYGNSERLRIAQVAPLAESVPPKLYGGTERVVATLTDELVHQGHDVTLFASGDSCTEATLVAAVPKALRLAKCADPLAQHLLLVELITQRADEFDVSRSPNRHVAFGGFGTHHCLGASLARLELRVLLEELLRRFPDVALDEGELRMRPASFIVGLESMPVRLR